MEINKNSKEQFEMQMAINKAHLIMLVEQGIISNELGREIADALINYDIEKLPVGKSGDLRTDYVTVEKQLIERVGEQAGNLHIARSNNDLGITMGRLTLRAKLLKVINTSAGLMNSLIELASKHTETVCIGYTHTQHGQPTTFAHYLMAFVDVLARDIHRMRSAYENCDRCSMGAAAITTSGFPIDRELVARLLAFESLAENSYDAIAGADHVGETATCVQLCAINAGRFIQDLLTFHTEEFNAILLAEGYTGGSSIMPQKRNPGAFEGIRAELSACAGEAAGVLMMLHNTPFTDIGDIKATPRSMIWSMLDRMENSFTVLTGAIATLYVDADVLLRRSKESYSTATEAADALVRAEGISFRTAHHILAAVVKQARADGLKFNELSYELFDKTAQAIIGRNLSLGEEALKNAIDPVHFVAVRDRTGGPAPREVNRMINLRKETAAAFLQWAHNREEAWRDALRSLDEKLAQI